jgi:hypothetical protein
LNKQVITAGLSSLGVGAVSYWSFLRGDIMGGAIGAFLCGVGVAAFIYEVQDYFKKAK